MKKVLMSLMLAGSLVWVTGTGNATVNAQELVPLNGVNALKPAPVNGIDDKKRESYVGRKVDAVDLGYLCLCTLDQEVSSSESDSIFSPTSVGYLMSASGALEQCRKNAAKALTSLENCKAFVTWFKILSEAYLADRGKTVYRTATLDLANQSLRAVLPQYRMPISVALENIAHFLSHEEVVNLYTKLMNTPDPAIKKHAFDRLITRTGPGLEKSEFHYYTERNKNSIFYKILPQLTSAKLKDSPLEFQEWWAFAVNELVGGSFVPELTVRHKFTAGLIYLLTSSWNWREKPQAVKIACSALAKMVATKLSHLANIFIDIIHSHPDRAIHAIANLEEMIVAGTPEMLQKTVVIQLERNAEKYPKLIVAALIAAFDNPKLESIPVRETILNNLRDIALNIPETAPGILGFLEKIASGTERLADDAKNGIERINEKYKK